MMLQIKRVYDKPAASDGWRVLVDRLWPRGLTKAQAAADIWLKNIAPSPRLRTWFAHDPQKFDEFRKRYSAELAENPATAELTQLMKLHKKITLLYGAKDPAVNHAVVLRAYLSKK